MLSGRKIGSVGVRRGRLCGSIGCFAHGVRKLTELKHHFHRQLRCSGARRSRPTRIAFLRFAPDNAVHKLRVTQAFLFGKFLWLILE